MIPTNQTIVCTKRKNVSVENFQTKILTFGWLPKSHACGFCHNMYHLKLELAHCWSTLPTLLVVLDSVNSSCVQNSIQLWFSIVFRISTNSKKSQGRRKNVISHKIRYLLFNCDIDNLKHCVLNLVCWILY